MHEEVALSDEFVDAVARRVLELSRRKLTVRDVAQLYGVHPTWVYAHADRLGAIRLGPGPKAALRFDPDQLDERIRTLGDRGPTEAPPKANKRAGLSRKRRALRGARPDLLPIGGDLLVEHDVDGEAVDADRVHERRAS
ncbi:hypothetical protein Q5424_08215 [Conexibacter sp. JD483]|uniref:hypothetical protein n=1 Tax=unclassified Conexibacter TaxID=2627773 RepID=UPI002727D8DD|nr:MULTISPECIES: hypothetical protein [unclassified Conexibacter]MDO8183978.1 hypothetical protein [Conexibacter sp. CPCC 205706]MDO8196970.1 hypothetical protein [Conexibacter sp. CPCC 205762]MDR9369060.1 hypothetical protein [Conexibacter sp. JD483]